MTTRRRLLALLPPLEKKTQAAWDELTGALDDILEPPAFEALLTMWASGETTEEAIAAAGKAETHPPVEAAWYKFLRFAEAVERLEKVRK
jgi:hypothetical protein